MNSNTEQHYTGSDHHQPIIISLEGEIKGRDGHVFLRKNVDYLRLVENDIAITMCERALALQELQREEKKKFQELVDYYETILMERYSADRRKSSARKNYAIESLNGCFKAEFSVSDFLRVTANIHAAQALVNEILADLLNQVTANEGEASKDVYEDVKTLLNGAFVRDEKGRLSVERLQQVRRMKLSHPKWENLRTAIADSLESSHSRSYMRFKMRKDATEAWEPINLQFSAL